MRVLVTGGTGFLGSHCVEALGRAGHTIRLLVRSPEKIKSALGERAIEIDDFVVGDMVDAGAVARALEDCDAVLHTAVTMYGDARVLEANIAGVHNVIGGAVERGIDPILYTSSIGSMFPPPGPIATADDPVVALETTYGHSKSAGERFVRELQDEGAPITTIYPGGIYGPHDPVFGETNKGLRDAIRFGFPICPTGGNTVVDVRDLAAIVLACLESGRGPRRFMAGGHFLTWAEYADACERVTARKMVRIPTPPRLLRAAGWMLDRVKRIVPFDYPLTHEATLFITQATPCDSRPTLDALGMEFRPLDETLRDAIRWLYQIGQIEARHAGVLAEDPADR